MLLRRPCLLMVCASLSFACATRGQDSQLLWPDGAPGVLGGEAKDKPTLIIYARCQPARPMGTAVVV